MHGTLVSNLLQPRDLFLSKVACESYYAFDPMYESFACVLALLAILSVEALLAQSDGYPFQWPAFAPGVEGRRHRDATTQRAQQQRVRIRSRVFASGDERLVGDEGMAVAIPHFVLQIV